MKFCDILDRHESGINTRLGIQNAGGNEEVLFSAAKIFLNGIDAVFVVINGLNDSENSLREFSAAMHGLKGSLLNIGATRLSARAARLEESAKNKDYNYCVKNAPEFLNKMSLFKDNLTAAVLEYKSETEAKKHIREPADITMLSEKAERLRNALIDYDVDLAEECAEKLLGISEETDKIVCEIKDLIKRFDFEAAVNKTERLINENQ